MCSGTLRANHQGVILADCVFTNPIESRLRILQKQLLKTESLIARFPSGKIRRFLEGRFSQVEAEMKRLGRLLPLYPC